MTRPRLCGFAMILGGLAVVAIACDQPTRTKLPRSNATPTPEVVSVDPAVVGTPSPAPEPVKPRPILGERTQDIRDAKDAAPAGGVVASQKIVAKDPILLVGNAYVSIVGQASMLNIQHAVDLYQATNGEYPKTYDEFMDQIIKANNIALPKLPFYQEYHYDVPTHSLVIYEYPDRKVQAGYPGAK